MYFIGAVFGILLGIGSIAGGAILGGIIASFIPALGFLGAGLFIIMGLALIALGILAIFVGRGLWKGKSWARIVAIILTIIGLVMGLVAMIQGEVSSNIVGVILNLVIGSYLLFSPKVKNAFV